MLIGYADADWAGDSEDGHSTTGNLFLMAEGPVSWLSKNRLLLLCLSVQPPRRWSGSESCLQISKRDPR